MRSADRIVAVSRLWGAIEYFDPDVVGNSDFNWDEAFAKNIGAIEAAGSTAEYANAVEQMLAALHDPATRIVAPAATDSKPTGPEFTSQMQNGVAILRIGDPAAFASNNTGTDSTVDEFVRDTANTKGVIDLRVSRPLTSDEAGGIDSVLQPYYRTPLVYGTIFTPSTLSIKYRGLPSSIESGFYGMSFDNETGSPIYGTAKRAVPMSLVINKDSEIPPMLLALIDAGKCHVIVEGAGPNLPASVTAIPLTEGVTAVVRSADYGKTLDVGSSAVTVLPTGSDQEVAIRR
ncbi:MAG: hypothetical protein JO113_07560, partial [Candidatus Eremiobacteraeota bacterium]|nr:hypothetical protein [Candidatus Eremiobacteraeota bacterium]